MITVLDLEVDPEYRYLGPEIDRLIPGETAYHVFVEDPTPPDVKACDGIVLSGSTASVYDEEHTDWIAPTSTLIERCLEENVPLLGICFGHQLVHETLGGTVEKDERRATFVEMEHEAAGVLEGLEPIVPVLHADLVVEPAAGFRSTARTVYNDHFCTRHEEAPLWTVQFHPEFTSRVRDEPSDWSDGEFTFEDSNAVTVLNNFAVRCRR